MNEQGEGHDRPYRTSQLLKLISSLKKERLWGELVAKPPLSRAAFPLSSLLFPPLLFKSKSF